VKKQKRFNVKRYFQVLGISMASILCILLVVLIFKPLSPIPSSDKGLTREEIATVKTSDGKINVLLLGVDEGGLRTDCMMLVSYDTKEKKASMLSIPRDTRMYVGTKYQKINAAHAIKASNGKPIGAQGSVEAVSRLTGVPINYYVEMTFDDVAQCINLLGPVTFEIPDLYNDGVGMVYDDPVQGHHINLKPGVQELDGAKVVQLLRYRKNNMVNGKRNQYPNGDIGRIAMQQEFMQELVDQKLNAELILKLPALFKQVTNTIKTNLSAKDVMSYSTELEGFTSGNLKAFSLPGDAQTINGVSYWICDLDETRELIQTEFGYSASNITIDKEPGMSKDTSKDTATKATAKATAKSTSKATAKATSKADSDETVKPTSKATNRPDSDDEDDEERTSAKPSASAKESNKPSPSASSKATHTAEPQATSNSNETDKKPVATKAPETSKPHATKVPQKDESTGNGEGNSNTGDVQTVPVKREEE